MTNFTVVILAGGESSRMGQDKAMLTLPDSGTDSGNLTLLQHMVKIAEQSGASRVIVNRNDNSSDTFLPDLRPGQGPLSGVHSVLAHLDNSDDNAHNLLLFLAVDMPLISPDLIRKLVKHAVDSKQAVYYQEQMLPLCLHKDRNYINYLSDVIMTRGNTSIRAFLKYIEAEAVECNEPDKLMSANTPEAWSYCCEKLA